jgi:hypothetical protein
VMPDIAVSADGETGCRRLREARDTRKVMSGLAWIKRRIRFDCVGFRCQRVPPKAATPEV